MGTRKENINNHHDISKDILAIGFGATFGAWIGYTIVNSSYADRIQEDSNDEEIKASHQKIAQSNPVQPLRSEDIPRAKEYFLNKPERYKGTNIRDYTMFYLNVNIGLRVRDLVNLKISDVMEDGCIKDVLYVKECGDLNKNKPIREIPLRVELKNLLLDYIATLENLSEDRLLFQARANTNKPMTRKNVYLKMQDMKEALNLDGVIGTLSMQKTFSKEKVFQLIGNEDFTDIENVAYITVGYDEAPKVYGHGDVI